MKKRSALSILSAAVCTFVLSSSMALAKDDVGPLGTGDDFDIVGYGSQVTDVTSKSAYLWAFTEGEGRDLSYVRVYSYFYVNGQMVDSDYTNDPSYADIDYDAEATNLSKARITSSHYAYNQLGDTKTKTSEDQWPN